MIFAPWSDRWISNRHRIWGSDLFMTDKDVIITNGDDIATWHTINDKGFVTVEYEIHFGDPIPVAQIEYKTNMNWDIKDWNIRLLKNDSDAHSPAIPFFIVVWDDISLEFLVCPINQTAKKFVPENIRLNEMDYVKLLYRLRDKEITTLQQVALLNRINEEQEKQHKIKTAFEQQMLDAAKRVNMSFMTTTKPLPGITSIIIPQEIDLSSQFNRQNQDDLVNLLTAIAKLLECGLKNMNSYSDNGCEFDALYILQNIIKKNGH